MAIVYPDFQTISKLRTPATEGEFHLLDELSFNLSSDFEIFFNPFLDGDRPDIIILRKGYGAVIIEVKDWNLSAYRVNTSNHWEVRTGTGSSTLLNRQCLKHFIIKAIYLIFIYQSLE